jgi:hypothetical protein
MEGVLGFLWTAGGVAGGGSNLGPGCGLGTSFYF